MSIQHLNDANYMANIKFPFVTVDPVDAESEGYLSVSNGHTKNPLVADMTYSFVASADNTFSFNRQAGDPSPLSTVWSVDAGGDFSFGGAVSLNNVLSMNNYAIDYGNNNLVYYDSGNQILVLKSANTVLSDAPFVAKSYSNNSGVASVVADISPTNTQINVQTTEYTLLATIDCSSFTNYKFLGVSFLQGTVNTPDGGNGGCLFYITDRSCLAGPSNFSNVLQCAKIALNVDAVTGNPRSLGVIETIFAPSFSTGPNLYVYAIGANESINIGWNGSSTNQEQVKLQVRGVL